MGFRSGQAAAPQATSDTSSQKSSASRTNSWGSEYSDFKTEKDAAHASHHHHHHQNKWFGEFRKDHHGGSAHHRPSHNRNVSGTSTGSAHKDRSHTNVHTHCGRHSDQYLFGPVSDFVKSAFRKE